METGILKGMAKEEKEEKDQEFLFDRLARHTDRADYADEYIRELRDHDRN